METRPLAAAGITAIGADDPARSSQAPTRPKTVRREPIDRNSPKHLDAHLAGAVHQKLMKDEAANPKSAALLQARFRCHTRLNEADTLKRIAVGRAELDTESGKGPDAGGHQTLAASFIDGRMIAIEHGHAKAVGAGSNRGAQTSGTATDNQNVRIQ